MHVVYLVVGHLLYMDESLDSIPGIGRKDGPEVGKEKGKQIYFMRDDS